MVNPVSPVLGYNNNVRHRNRVFHIQTEDSGVRHPHIITHLFVDGGRIIKSLKTSYTEHLGAAGLAETVRGMMKEQHKAMFLALRQGAFDEIIGASSGVPSVESAIVESSRPSSRSLAASEQMPAELKSDGEELRLSSVELAALPVVDASDMTSNASPLSASIMPEVSSNMMSEPAPRKPVDAARALVAALAFPQVAIQEQRAAATPSSPSLAQVYPDAVMTMRPDIATIEETAVASRSHASSVARGSTDSAAAAALGPDPALGSAAQIMHTGDREHDSTSAGGAQAVARAVVGDYAKTIQAAIFQGESVAAPLTFDPALDHLILGYLTRNLGA